MATRNTVGLSAHERLGVYSVRKYEEDREEKSKWTQIGTAFGCKDRGRGRGARGDEAERRRRPRWAFAHHAASSLPTVEAEGATLRIIAGRVFGEQSPVEVASELFYADATLAPGASLSLGREHEERGLHLVNGSLEIAGKTFEAGALLALASGRPAAIRAPRGARLLLLGGARLDGPRHLWWNFVSSRPDRIERAKEGPCGDDRCAVSHHVGSPGLNPLHQKGLDDALEHGVIPLVETHRAVRGDHMRR